MKITYIYHSCFTVELEKSVLIFDYYMGELPAFSKDKKIYVFASHNHGDHFAIEVLDWIHQYPHISFLLGSDIPVDAQYLKKNGKDITVKDHIRTVKEHSTLTLDDMHIQALHSTDEGVAFCIELEGKSIYHAGDLNWWHWEGEPGDFNKDQEKVYKREIDSIGGRHFDAAFVPVDPRLMDATYYGIDYFMAHTKTDHVFPMHFWRKYDMFQQLTNRKESEPYRDSIMTIKEEGQSWEL